MHFLLRVFPLFDAPSASSSPIFPLLCFAASAPLLSCCSFLSGSSLDTFPGDREGGGGEGKGEIEGQGLLWSPSTRIPQPIEWGRPESTQCCPCLRLRILRRGGGRGPRRVLSARELSLLFLCIQLVLLLIFSFSCHGASGWNAEAEEFYPSNYMPWTMPEKS